MQLGIGLLSFPLVALPFTDGSVPIPQLPGYMRNAAKCTFGTVPRPGQDDDCGKDSAPAAAIMAAFIVFNLCFCSLMLLVFRMGSSTLFSIAGVAKIPLVAAMLLVPALAGPQRSHFQWTDAVAAAMAVAGLVLYQYKPELRKKTEAQEDTLATPLLDAEGEESE